MPGKQSVTRGVRLSVDMHETLTKLARMQNVKLNRLIVRLLQEKIHEYYQQNIVS